MEVERTLDEKGFDPGSVDGVIDNRTQRAITEFQRQNDLPVTGSIDEQTSERLGIASNMQSPHWRDNSQTDRSSDSLGSTGSRSESQPGEHQESSPVYR